MGSNTHIVHLKIQPIGTKFKCKIGPIDEWRIYEKNNVKYVCPNDDSKNMANRNWELNEFCSTFNDREIEIIEDNIVKNKKEYKFGDVIKSDEIENLPINSIIMSILDGVYYCLTCREIDIINTPIVIKYDDIKTWAGDEFRIITLGYK